MKELDIVTKANFDEFINSFSLSETPEDIAFEKFSIYSIGSSFVKSETLSKSLLCDINIGGGCDWGIDGFLIIINGKVVTTKEAVDDLLKANGTISVKFIIIQAKRSLNFDAAELGMALDGIENLLRDVSGETCLPACNPDLSEYRELVKYIYSHSTDFTDGKNPRIYGFYVCCGIYNEQADFESKKKKAEDFINQTDLVESFEYKFVDKKGIVKFYKDTKAKPEVTINIEQKVSLPKVEHISDAYLCILPFAELKKLFISEDSIMQEVFYDNVRAFQGQNPVNRAISESLREGNTDLFTAMNNGITITAKKIHPTGHDIRLSDYQIVNGCQTCNVLYINRNLPKIDNVKVVVKLIASEDKEIRDRIIVANNSQTEVKREQLVSLLEVQRYIEDYYNSQNKYEKLYYERRSKQYRTSDHKVPNNKIITIPVQIQAFVSMILGAPDKVSGYYGSIVDEFDRNGKKVFSPDTNPALYYTCALASYKMTEMFANGTLDRSYNKIKFHILLAFRLMCEKKSIPQFNAHDVQDYCDHLCTILCDDVRCKDAFLAAAKLIDCALKREPKDGDRMNESFTKKMKELAARANELNKQKKNYKG